MKYTEDQINNVVNAFAEAETKFRKKAPNQVPAEQPTETSDIEKEVEVKRLSFKTNGHKIDVIDGHLYIDDQPRDELKSGDDMAAIMKLIAKLAKEKE
jgi:predicted glycoside hydrolase/deacetylase ChbG (UPF0249 family)